MKCSSSHSKADRLAKASGNPWWRGGVIYQIYPRSFADSNADGIGDLRGITARLEYLAKLGVDAIWLSPFFRSPMKDFGYDVSNYCDVDPIFGTIQDAKQLIKEAHRFGLKIMIDQVLSHSSDQHPWFVESRQNRTNEKADWYVWADARPDGSPPNNWLSVFGGSAWQWDTRRAQYYFHNFLSSQPDLNFHHEPVREAMLETVRFWLDLGVDGLRLDTANFYYHDQQLRDNPPRDRQSSVVDLSVGDFNPYMFQMHCFDKSRPENLGFLRDLRRLLDGYPSRAMVGEIGDDDGLARIAEYTAGNDKLHMAYSFDLLGPTHDAGFLYHTFDRFESIVGDGWPSWALSNHDVGRVASRWACDQLPAFERLAKLQLIAALQMCLRGSPCIYQGDELGLPDAELAFEDLQDPYGISMWPEFKGRDACRTPMPWHRDASDLGFGSGQQRPWLPLSESHRKLAVDRQLNDPNSTLNFYRALLAWRKQIPVLQTGSMRLCAEHKSCLAFFRESENQTLLCVFNLSGKFQRLSAGELGLLKADISRAKPLDSPLSGLALKADRIGLSAWGCGVIGLMS
jgi:alpha-glucosidase